MRIKPRACGLVLSTTELNPQPGVCVLFIANEVLWIKWLAGRNVGDSRFEKWFLAAPQCGWCSELFIPLASSSLIVVPWGVYSHPRPTAETDAQPWPLTCSHRDANLKEWFGGQGLSFCLGQKFSQPIQGRGRTEESSRHTDWIE